MAIARLLQNGGIPRGQQLLRAEKAEEALYRTGVRGRPTPADHHRLSGFTYHMGLWHFPFGLTACTIDTLNMFEPGGNLVQLLPAGTIGFQLKDVGLSAHRGMAEAVNTLGPLRCPGGQPM